ncbi:hypothetical protein [Streptomyces sp. G-5]|uniref:hypothetical protein n=1 Tax=Streptomyces sp. G-5 TaxID=2977231 RepID=UPI0021D22042|nr:hypothetical protein [Streptomyces sp. G-5]MCU4750216.1 hypothetical protein [Streptomyces sp. G-5]
MKTIDGRRYASRNDLISHSNYSRAQLANLWRDRDTNGHPPAVILDRVMHWDLEAWDTWLARYQHERGVGNRRGAVGRRADPQRAHRLELAAAARAAHPETPLRDIAHQLAAEHGGSPHTWNGLLTEARPAKDPRPELAAEALAAHPQWRVGAVAEMLAAEHGQSVKTWQNILSDVAPLPTSEHGGSPHTRRGPLTEARSVKARRELAAEALAAHPQWRAVAVAEMLAAEHGYSVKTWQNILSDVHRGQRD